MATPLGDTQSTPATWTNWQAMRFLYQDINSLLYGGGLDLSQFSLPALNLPHYFNTFSLIQGTGSSNSGTGFGGGGGGGGGSIVLQCDLCNFANKMSSYDISQYIANQGSFSISALASSIYSNGLAVQNLPDLGAPGQPISCTPPDPIALGTASTSFSVDICPPHACSNVTGISLVFSISGTVKASAGILTGLFCSFTEWRSVVHIDMTYVLSASVGLGNTYNQTGSLGLALPVSALDLIIAGSHTGVICNNSCVVGVIVGSFIPTLIDSPQPTLRQGFKNILTQSNCTC